MFFKHSYLLILFFPLIFLADFFLYFINRSSCLSCGNLIEFYRNGSLSIYVISNLKAQILEPYLKSKM